MPSSFAAARGLDLAIRQVLEIAVGLYPLPQHDSDVLRVIYDRVRKPPVQFFRECRLARAESAVDPDNHRHKLSGYLLGCLVPRSSPEALGECRTSDLRREALWFEWR